MSFQCFLKYVLVLKTTCSLASILFLKVLPRFISEKWLEFFPETIKFGEDADTNRVFLGFKCFQELINDILQSSVSSSQLVWCLSELVINVNPAGRDTQLCPFPCPWATLSLLQHQLASIPGVVLTLQILASDKKMTIVHVLLRANLFSFRS